MASLIQTAAFVSGLLLASMTQAQNRNTNWLSNLNWIRFDSDGPNLVAHDSSFACGAMLSDTMGNLLLYSSGTGLQGQVAGIRSGSQALISNQPSPSTLAGSMSQAQRVLFIPKPGSDDRAFMFMWAPDNGQGLGESDFGWVEIHLVTGAEYVVDPDFIWLGSEATAKRAAVAHYDGQRYWLLTHTVADAEFRAFLISNDGVTDPPVISQVGSPPPADWIYGKMIPNSDGDMFVAISEPLNYDWADSSAAQVELLSFNLAVGNVELLYSFPDLRRAKGAEFSPNGRYLYLAEWHTPVGAQLPGNRRLYQYDLMAGDIGASRTLLDEYTTNSPDLSTSNVLALAPDGRIYVAGEIGDAVLGVIQNPDSSAPDCAYLDQGVACPTMWTRLPAPVKRYHHDTLALANGIAQMDVPSALQISPNPAYDRIRIMHAPSTTRTFSIRDAIGRVAHAGPLVQNTIDLSGVASGSYVIEVLDAHGVHLGTARVMKE
jgi:hypothetical protein